MNLHDNAWQPADLIRVHSHLTRRCSDMLHVELHLYAYSRLCHLMALSLSHPHFKPLDQDDLQQSQAMHCNLCGCNELIIAAEHHVCKANGREKTSSDNVPSTLWLFPLQIDHFIIVQAPCTAIWHCNVLLLGTLLTDILDNHGPACSGPAGEMLAAASPIQFCTVLNSRGAQSHEMHHSQGQNPRARHAMQLGMQCMKSNNQNR